MSSCRQYSQRLLLAKIVDYTFELFTQHYPLSLGARSVLPMGVAPKAIAEFFWVYAQKYIVLHLCYSCVDSSSVHQLLPMVLALESTRMGCIEIF
jgi:hypothetical protein